MTASSLTDQSPSHHSPSQSCGSTTSSKRYASTFDGEDDEEEDVKPPVGKRAKANTSTKAAPAKTLTEKLERKEARMIRNRNAAQASRDRKKEHTQHLEARVAELEAQLEFAKAGQYTTPAPRHAAPPPPAQPAPQIKKEAVAAAVPSVYQPPPPTTSRQQAAAANAAAAAAASAAAALAASTNSSKQLDRRERSPSVFSVSSSTPSVGAELLELEDENDTLRTQLELERLESARLRSRLESLEERFVHFEQLMHRTDNETSGAGTSSTIDSSLLSTSTKNSSTTSLALEPTFTFDHQASVVVPPPTTPSSSSSTSMTTRSASSKAASGQTKDSKDGAKPLTARDLGTGSPVFSLSSASSSSSVVDLDLVDSAPTTTSSSSFDSFAPLDPMAPASPPNLEDVWHEWAHGISVLGGDEKGEPSLVEKVEEEDPTMEFLDLSYLSDAPVASWC